MSTSGGQNPPVGSTLGGAQLFRDELATVSAWGTVVAPGASANICSIAAAALTTGGVYELTTWGFYGATADVAGNVKLVAAGTNLHFAPIMQGVANGNAVPVSCVFVHDGATAVAVQATVAGAVGSIYNAAIVARRIA